MREMPIAKQQLDDQAVSVVQYEGKVKADLGTVAYDRVGLRLVDPGDTVFADSDSTLVVITQFQPITVVFHVSEDDLPEVQAQSHGGQSL
jgi:multidrug efflux system membrane fusion protein